MKKIVFPKINFGRLTIGILLFVLLIVLINSWILGEILDIDKKLLENNKFMTTLDVLKNKIRKGANINNVERRVHVDPTRDFSLSIFYIGDIEIARFKNMGEKIYDLQGDIPNGRVKFINLTENTHGTEYYRNGKRHGLYKEYYDNSRLKREAEYFKGKLRNEVIHYYDGTIRMEADYTDALRFVEDREVGEGRVYYRDGTLMYEWRLTNRASGGYKKSYNIKGELVEAKFYDHNADMVKYYHYKK